MVLKSKKMMASMSATLAIAAIFLSTSQAFESHLKFRIHRELLQGIFSKNFDLLLSKVEKDQEKDVTLEDLNTKMTDVHIGIRPALGGSWDSMTPFETFFDDGQVIFEGHDLEFQGSGLIIDPTTGAREAIGFHAPLTTCQIVVSLGEEYAAWGSLYPRFNIDQVLFQLDETLLTVSSFGELPLFQTHNFEKAVKKWFTSQVSKRQDEFKASL